MKAFLLSLLVMLREFLTSKKVLTAALTAVAGAFIKDPAVRDRVVAAGLFLLTAIAAVDHATASAGGKTTVGAKTTTPEEHAAAVSAAVKALLLEGLDRALKAATPPVVVPIVSVGPAPHGVSVPSTTVTVTQPGFAGVAATGIAVSQAAPPEAMATATTEAAPALDLSKLEPPSAGQAGVYPPKPGAGP